MEWVQIFTLVIGNAALVIPLFLWNRSESRADYRHMESGLKSSLDGIREEMRDFHTRLCAIEERNRK